MGEINPTMTSEQANDQSWQQALRTPLVIGLAGLLAVQLLAAAIASGGNRLTPASRDTPFAAFDAERITRVEIATPESKTPLLLTRAESGWIIPALEDFPADGMRIEQLLEALAQLRRPLPIATSETARARFKVADDGFAERIVLGDGKDTLANLLLGDSPGFRRRYLRPAGDDGIYDVRFEVFNLSAQPEDWIVRDRLRLELERIERLASADWTLSRDGDDWTLHQGEEARAADSTRVNALLSALAYLGYREVRVGAVGEGAEPTPLLALDIGLRDGKSLSYQIARPGQDPAEQDSEEFILTITGQPHRFLVPAFALAPLLELDVSELAQPPEAEPEVEAEAEAEADE